jgi:hypothetical protein
MTQADRVHSTPPTNTPVDTTRRFETLKDAEDALMEQGFKLVPDTCNWIDDAARIDAGVYPEEAYGISKYRIEYRALDATPTRRRFLTVAAIGSMIGAGSLAFAAAAPNDVPQAVTMPTPRHSELDAEMTAAVTEIATIDDTLHAMHKKYGDDADSQDDYIDFADRRLDLLEMMGSTPSMSRIGIEAKAAALLMNDLACDYSRFGDVAESLALDILALAKAVRS